MRLAELQQSLGVLLLEREGHQVLESESDWRQFLDTDSGRPLAGCSRERLALYEELLFSSVEDTLDSLYPFCKKLIDTEEDRWFSLVERYRREHPNLSYQLYLSAASFPLFLSRQRKLLETYPFLVDLAWYEWLEVEVLNAPDIPTPEDFSPEIPNEVALLAHWAPVLNPITRMRTYAYPIPHILEAIKHWGEGDAPPDFSQAPESPAEILIYRDPETFRARFFQLNPMTSALIRAWEYAASFQVAFETLLNTEPTLKSFSLETLMSQGLAMIRQCHAQGVLPGSRPKGFNG